MDKRFLTNKDVELLAHQLAKFLRGRYSTRPIRIAGIPRGGIPVAYLLLKFDGFVLAEDEASAMVFVDDIIDSGRTAEEWQQRTGKEVFALLDKSNHNSLANGSAAKMLLSAGWIVFPWEVGKEQEQVSEDNSIVGTITNRLRTNGTSFFANDNIASHIEPHEMEELQNEVQRRAESFLRGLIIDVDNDHNTQGTAKRMAKMYLHEVFKGRYKPAPHLTDFPNAKMLDEMYTTGPITIRSACSHHLAPIIGRCWIGIVPGHRVIGLSKFNRIVDWFASRAQIQEELAVQIADYLEDTMKPSGLAVVIEATHLCMTWRGVREPQQAAMTTSVMRGVLREKPEARAEFMAFIKG